MARKSLKNPVRAAHRARERASREARGLHEARVIVPREHDPILRGCARKLRTDPAFAAALAALLELDAATPDDAAAVLPLASAEKPKGCVVPTRKQVRKAKGKGGLAEAALGDLFGFGIGDTEGA